MSTAVRDALGAWRQFLDTVATSAYAPRVKYTKSSTILSCLAPLPGLQELLVEGDEPFGGRVGDNETSSPRLADGPLTVRLSRCLEVQKFNCMPARADIAAYEAFYS